MSAEPLDHPGLIARALVACVRSYQRRLSRLLAPRCRFTPTCSDYFLQAVTVKGAFLGALLGVWRIMRCNPWSRGGHDPLK